MKFDITSDLLYTLIRNGAKKLIAIVGDAYSSNPMLRQHDKCCLVAWRLPMSVIRNGYLLQRIHTARYERY
ncbi:MAG: hypothetical protein ACTS73_01795 [Arsenophonus sp. NEOnobi-MAG3]